MGNRRRINNPQPNNARDSLIGRNVTILNHEQNLPRGHKLIVGDQTTITL